jgi:hypothetical protein
MHDQAHEHLHGKTGWKGNCADVVAQIPRHPVIRQGGQVPIHVSAQKSIRVLRADQAVLGNRKT